MICPEGYFIPSMYCAELQTSLQRRGMIEVIYSAADQAHGRESGSLPRDNCFEFVKLVAELITLHYVQQNAGQLRYFSAKSDRIYLADPIIVRPSSGLPTDLPLSLTDGHGVAPSHQNPLPFVDCSVWCIDATLAKQGSARSVFRALVDNILALDGCSLCFPVNIKPDSAADSARTTIAQINEVQYPQISVPCSGGAISPPRGQSQRRLSEPAPSGKAGRPRVSVEALDIFLEMFPSGKDGKTWKEIATTVSRELPEGRSIGEQALSRAVNAHEKRTVKAVNRSV